MADPAKSPPLTRAGVQAAHERIRPYVHHTPTLTNATLTALASSPRKPSATTAGEVPSNSGGDDKTPIMRLYFKCENMQRIGAFKARGAFHALGRLIDEPGWLESGGKDKGVVTHSSGKKGSFGSCCSHRSLLALGIFLLSQNSRSCHCRS